MTKVAVIVLVWNTCFFKKKKAIIKYESKILKAKFLSCVALCKYLKAYFDYLVILTMPAVFKCINFARQTIPFNLSSFCLSSHSIKKILKVILKDLISFAIQIAFLEPTFFLNYTLTVLNNFSRKLSEAVLSTAKASQQLSCK